MKSSYGRVCLCLILLTVLLQPGNVNGATNDAQPTPDAAALQALDRSGEEPSIPPLPHDLAWLRAQQWLQPASGVEHPSRYSGHGTGPQMPDSNLPVMYMPAVFNRYSSIVPPVVGVDLDVAYIERTPRYSAYKVSYFADQWSCPYPYPNDRGPFLCLDNVGQKRWPVNGEVVQFIAHVFNKGSTASPPFPFVWMIDDVVVQSGVGASLAPGVEATFSLSQPWPHTLDGERLLGSHTIRFHVDPFGAIPEDYESNNWLSDYTQAAGLRFVIHPTTYAVLNAGCLAGVPHSAEDFIQEHLALMNDRLANSVYPGLAPQGSLQRVRLDKVVVSSNPLPGNLGFDGNWWIDSGYLCPATDPNWRDWGLVHELGHQLGAIDLYHYNTDYYRFDNIQDRFGQPAVSRWDWPRPGIMGGGDIGTNASPAFSDHTVVGLNRNAGYRRGFYGEYQFDLPSEIRLQVLDNSGIPASGVTVRLYQRRDELWFSGVPTIEGTTDANGIFILPNRTVNGGTTTATGHVLHDNPFGPVDVIGPHNTFFMQLRQGDHEEYGWLRVTDLNLNHWRNQSNTYTLDSHAPSSSAPAPPANLITERIEYGQVFLRWDASPDPSVTGYNVYRATSPTFAYTRVLTGTTATQAWFGTEGSESVYAVTAQDVFGEESGFGRFTYAPTFHDWVMDVGLLRQNHRLIFDAGTEKHLVLQQPDGRFLQRVGTVHHHWNDVRGLAGDSCGQNFALAQTGTDQPDTIQIYDARAELTQQFGGTGTGLGQFRAPHGVDVMGCLNSPYQESAPARLDNRAVFLARFDGSLADEHGYLGQITGPVSFVAGRYGSAVFVPENGTLTYGDTGLMQANSGAIELWVRPSGLSPYYKVFLDVGTMPEQAGLRIDQVGHWTRVLVWNNNTARAVSSLVNWEPETWHHLAVMWHGDRLRFHIDGLMVGEETLPHGMPSALWPLHVGTRYDGTDSAAAAYDDLRMSTIARLGNLADARVFVADTGNHRIQVLDGLGNALTSYGSQGGAAGQFRSPWDLAADSTGRIAVSDTGNNRIQWLTYNGSSFSYVRQATGLNQPRGIDLDGYGQVIVANAGANQVRIYGADAILRATHTTPASPYAGAFSEPSSVLVDANHRIVVADKGNQRVVEVADPLLCLPVDLNFDRQINVLDIVTVAALWQKNIGDDADDPQLDINDDGTIDVRDIMIVASHFNEICD